jgi:hypothetical protein
MDDHSLTDIKRLLIDGLENTDWKCVEEALEIIKELQGDYDDEFAEYDN